MLCGGQGKSMKEEELAGSAHGQFPKIAVSLILRRSKRAMACLQQLSLRVGFCIPPRLFTMRMKFATRENSPSHYDPTAWHRAEDFLQRSGRRPHSLLELYLTPFPACSTNSCALPDPIRWSVSAVKYSCSALLLWC
jgi:hypothetical protein